MTEISIAGRSRELSPDRLPWEKQPFESFPAFQAFALYRDLGLARSLSKAAGILVETVPERKQDSVRKQMSDFSAKNRWVERAEQYDLHIDARMREQREGALAAQNRRYVAAAATASAALLRRLGDADADELAKMAKELDLEGMARALVNLQRVERLATGQTTEALGRGVFGINSSEAESIFRDLIELALPFVPEERQALYAQAVQAYISSGGKKL